MAGVHMTHALMLKALLEWCFVTDFYELIEHVDTKLPLKPNKLQLIRPSGGADTVGFEYKPGIYYLGVT